MGFISNLISYAAITGVLVIIVNAIALMKKTHIEKLLLQEEKKIFIDLIRIAILTIVLSIIVYEYTAWKTGEKISDYIQEQQITVIAVLLISGLLLAIMMYVPFKSIISSGFPKKRYYYIDNEVHGKLYIIKSSGKNEIILSNRPEIFYDGYIVIISKEGLMFQKIHSEEVQDKAFELFKKWLKIKRGSKEISR